MANKRKQKKLVNKMRKQDLKALAKRMTELTAASGAFPSKVEEPFFKYILVIDSPIHGYEFHGPYRTPKHASADGNCLDMSEWDHNTQWWVAELETPDTDNEMFHRRKPERVADAEFEDTP